MKNKKLVSEITGMIEREGEGLLDDEGVDWEVAEGIAQDIVDEIINPLITINAELLGMLKDANDRLKDFIGNDCECDNTHKTNKTVCCLCNYKNIIKSAEGGNKS